MLKLSTHELYISLRIQMLVEPVQAAHKYGQNKPKLSQPEYSKLTIRTEDR